MIPIRTSILGIGRWSATNALRLILNGFMLAALLLAYPQAVQAQSTHGCYLRGAIPNSATNPGLVWDCETLLGLKDTLRGTAPLNWSADLPMSRWEGIHVSYVDGTQRVTAILFSTKNLSGTIPPKFGNLSGLNKVILIGTKLSGSIPSEIGNLTNLQTLSLQSDRLSGSIPPSIGNLTSLRSLSLSSNRLSGSMPATLGNLTNLEEMNLSVTKLSGSIPLTLGRLTNLKKLILYQNRLSGTIPAGLGNLTGLQSLDMHGNHLTGSIPATLGNLSNLRFLHLYGNQLSGRVPAELGNLTNLQGLSLQYNQLSGSLPWELGRLSNLKYMELQGNQFSGAIPESFANLSKLGSLILSNNKLSNVIPATFGSLGALTVLSADYNQLSGSIPSQLGNLTELRALRLSSNRLSGTIPSELSNLIHLQVLWLQHNQLTGAVPPTLVNLTSLHDIRLEGNRLADGFPAAFATLIELPGDKIRIQRYDVPEASFELGIGWVSRDGSRVVMVGVIRDQTLGQTYYIARPGGQSPRRAPLDLAHQPIGLFGPVAGRQHSIHRAGGDRPCHPLGRAPARAQHARAPLRRRRRAHLRLRCHNPTMAPHTQLADVSGPWLLLVRRHRCRLRLLRPHHRRPALSRHYHTGAGQLPQLQNVRSPCMNPLSASRLRTGKWSATHVLRIVLTNLVLFALLLAHPHAAQAQSSHGCATRGAVVNAATNPGLVWDCETLLGLKDNLRGTAPLNWSVSLAITAWDGISFWMVNGERRVSRISLVKAQLNGFIPPELANLTHLRTLNLAQNELSGGIPSELGNLTNLRDLGLQDNELQGAIPSSLGNLRNLQQLYLYVNELTGSIPPTLGNLSELRYLSLSSNQLTGNIPPELANLVRLDDLSLTYNRLSGHIPAQLGNLTNLKSLRLYGNELQGGIPITLANLANLRSLELTSNHLRRRHSAGTWQAHKSCDTESGQQSPQRQHPGCARESSPTATTVVGT